MAEALLDAVRALRGASPNLGVKPLLARLREQQPELEAGIKEVREALTALKAESEAKAAAAAPPAADKEGVPSHAAVILAWVGYARMPSDMGDGREKHPVCPKCVKLKVPTTYFCGINCPGNPQAWKMHAAYHKELNRLQKAQEDGGVAQQKNREAAEEAARIAAQTGDKYSKLLAEDIQYASKRDWRRAARACRTAIALRPDEPGAYYNLGNVLSDSGHLVEAAQRYLEAKERAPVGSKEWVRSTAGAINLLCRDTCAEVAKPEWWNDEGLKALSARVVRAAPNDLEANRIRATVLCGQCAAWEAGSRSAVELRKAATHFERTAALDSAPVLKADYAHNAGWCRHQAEAMSRCNGSKQS